MQNRYAGDVGDFGKLGLLRAIEKTGLKIGVNWYLVENESHNQDGKHVGYLKDKKFKNCDDELLQSLSSMLSKDSRSVEIIEQLGVLNTSKFHHDVVPTQTKVRRLLRQQWHQKALASMGDCNLVFLDPDNGLLPKSVSADSIKSVKYVLPEEIIGYYQMGYSVMFYNHRTREPLDVYLKRFETLFGNEALCDAEILGISYRRGTVRDYFFIIRKEHAVSIKYAIKFLMDSKWNLHFQMIQMEKK